MRRAVLTASITFEVLDNAKDRWERALQLRESLKELGDSVSRTPMQRLCEVMEAKELLEEQLGKAVGADQCAKHWESLTLASSSEPVKKSFVDACVTVKARLLNLDAPRNALLKSDATDAGAPFSSIYTLEAVVKRGSSPPAIEWLIMILLDYVKTGALTKSDISVEKLTGKRSGGKGLLDTLIAKHDAAKAFLVFAGNHMLHTATIKFLADWCIGIHKYRGVVQDQAAFSVLPKSNQAFIRLFEETLPTSACARKVRP